MSAEWVVPGCSWRTLASGVVVGRLVTRLLEGVVTLRHRLVRCCLRVRRLLLLVTGRAHALGLVPEVAGWWDSW
jgi:hypothetical protein